MGSSREKLVLLLKSLRFCQNNLCHKRLLGRKRSLMYFVHKSAIDFLTDEKKAGVYAVNVGQGHMVLADRCRHALKVRRKSTDRCRQYSLRHFVHHLCYLHEHPYQPKDGSSRPDPLLEAARVVLDLDW